MTAITIRVDGEAYEVEPGAEFTFGRGRECTACLDPADTAISRLAGSVGHEHGTWWLTNRSSARPLSVVDELGLRSVLAPGRRLAVEAPTLVLVAGQRTDHTVRIAVPAPSSAVGGEPPAEGVPTAIGTEVLITPADRLALIALFAGYLEEPPRYDPHPKSYAAAAARLGWPRTTLVKRIEYLRNRLHAAGVPDMVGWNALANLAEYAITRGLVSRDDLALLRR